MYERYVRVHKLAGGMRAAFVNMPHFRTTSVRLIINSGSLHETKQTIGAAHFLEHVTFKGTEAFPTQADIIRFEDEKNVYSNAYTGRTHTTYVTSGHELESTLYLAVQLALFPTIKPETVKAELGPITEEISGETSSPYFLANSAHRRAIWGEAYARQIGGSLEDVRKLDQQKLLTYYTRNYRLSNAMIVICSSETVERQREYLESLLSKVKKTGPIKPMTVEFPAYNPEGLDASLQSVNLPPDSTRTTLSIDYGLPELKGIEDLFYYDLISSVLSMSAYRRLRVGLSLSYGADADVAYIVNKNFGLQKSWSYLSVGSTLSGKNAIKALDVMLDEVILKPLPKDMLETVLRSIRYSVDDTLQSHPGSVADYIRSYMINFKLEELDLEMGKVLAEDVSIAKLHKIQRALTQTRPLVFATSPDTTVLDKVGEWARTRIG